MEVVDDSFGPKDSIMKSERLLEIEAGGITQDEIATWLARTNHEIEKLDLHLKDGDQRLLSAVDDRHRTHIVALQSRISGTRQRLKTRINARSEVGPVAADAASAFLNSDMPAQVAQNVSSSPCSLGTNASSARTLLAFGTKILSNLFNHNGDAAYRTALTYYRRLAELEGYAYRSALYHTVEWCQKALTYQRNDGDAMVLLSNAYLLVALDAEVQWGRIDSDMLVRAGRVIEHWNSRKPPTTERTLVSGSRLYNSIAEYVARLLSKGPDDAMKHIAMLPPGQLADSLNDRLSVGVVLFSKQYPNWPSMS